MSAEEDGAQESIGKEPRARGRASVGVELPHGGGVVEVSVGSGLPSYSVSGMADARVRESRERVRAATVNAGFEFPARPIRAAVPVGEARRGRSSAAIDHGIAVSILAASGQIGEAPATAAGELALDGSIRGEGASATHLADYRGEEATGERGFEGEYAAMLKVPVYAHVDVGRGEVTRVVVYDEAETVVETVEEVNSVAEPVRELTADDPRFKRIVEIVGDPDVEWPAWRFGF